MATSTNDKAPAAKAAKAEAVDDSTALVEGDVVDVDGTEVVVGAPVGVSPELTPAYGSHLNAPIAE